MHLILIHLSGFVLKLSPCIKLAPEKNRLSLENRYSLPGTDKKKGSILWHETLHILYFALCGQDTSEKMEVGCKVADRINQDILERVLGTFYTINQSIHYLIN